MARSTISREGKRVCPEQKGGEKNGKQQLNPHRAKGHHDKGCHDRAKEQSSGMDCVFKSQTSDYQLWDLGQLTAPLCASFPI